MLWEEILCPPLINTATSVKNCHYYRAALILSLICIGCGEPVTSSSEKRSRVDESPGIQAIDPTAGITPVTSDNLTKVSAVQSSNVSLSEANWDDLQTLIGEQKPKVVVVDVWSTACEPCMKEFPHLVELQKRFPKQVVAISFDVDYAGIKNKPVAYYRERVVKFLSSMADSPVKHLMCTTAADDLFTAINLDSIPAVYVYDQQGQLARRFAGSNGQDEGVSYVNQVIPFVEELVKSSDR